MKVKVDGLLAGLLSGQLLRATKSTTEISPSPDARLTTYQQLVVRDDYRQQRGEKNK